MQSSATGLRMRSNPARPTMGLASRLGPAAPGEGACGWWWSGRVLEPVRALQKAAEAIDAGALHRRVPLPEAEDELRRLGEVLNAMLARIESGFLQSRRFTADASHELRTPLTIMSGELDGELRLAEQSASDVTEFVLKLKRVPPAPSC